MLSSTEAQLYVPDVEAACAFYAGKLGFETAFTWGDPPFYAQVRRENARLNLRLVDEPVFVGDFREREQLLSATIVVNGEHEIERLVADFTSAGVRVVQRPKTESWGATTFVIADLDGNLILFAASAERGRTAPMIPAPIPEIPVENVAASVAYYVDKLGFVHDWGEAEGGIAGISHGECRLFISDRAFREPYGTRGPMLFWLNVRGKVEVDRLFEHWKSAGARLLSEPDDKAWKLREFIALDLDGNLIRVFYDFRHDSQTQATPVTDTADS